MQVIPMFEANIRRIRGLREAEPPVELRTAMKSGAEPDDPLKDEHGLLIASISKGSSREIRISLNEYKGTRYIDIREFFEIDGEFRPTKKGVTLRVDRFEELAEAILELGETLGYCSS